MFLLQSLKLSLLKHQTGNISLFSKQSTFFEDCI